MTKNVQRLKVLSVRAKNFKGIREVFLDLNGDLTPVHEIRGDTGQGVVGGGPAGSAKDEIEIFLTIVHEVPHFVIDAEAHITNCNVSSQKWRRCEEIKHDTPTCDFGMMITA